MSRKDQRIAVLSLLNVQSDLTASQILAGSKHCECEPFSKFTLNGELYHLATEGYILRTPDDKDKGIYPKFRITDLGEDHLEDWESKQPKSHLEDNY